MKKTFWLMMLALFMIVLGDMAPEPEGIPYYALGAYLAAWGTIRALKGMIDNEK